MDHFHIEPSAEYLERKAEVDRLRAKIRDSDPSPAGRDALLAAYDAAHTALHNTPEQKYIDEIESIARDSGENILESEARRRTRLVAKLSVSKEEISENYPEDLGFSEQCVSVDASHFIDEDDGVTLIANMQNVSAATLAGILRQMAHHIEIEGISVYRGDAPLPNMRPDWWVIEKTTGELTHRAYERP